MSNSANGANANGGSTSVWTIVGSTSVGGPSPADEMRGLEHLERLIPGRLQLDAGGSQGGDPFVGRDVRCEAGWVGRGNLLVSNPSNRQFCSWGIVGPASPRGQPTCHAIELWTCPQKMADHSQMLAS